MIVKPLSDRLAIKPFEPIKMTHGGIIIPDSAQKNQDMGIVVAVGPDIVSSNAATKPEIGDTVLYLKYVAPVVDDGKDKLLVLRLSDVLAILEDETELTSVS